MIKSALVYGPSTLPAPPPISFPFLWKGAFSGRIYLRVFSADALHGAPGYPDLCLINHPYDKHGVQAFTSEDDKDAWDRRLPAGQTVTLSNDT